MGQQELARKCLQHSKLCGMRGIGSEEELMAGRWNFFADERMCAASTDAEGSEYGPGYNPGSSKSEYEKAMEEIEAMRAKDPSAIEKINVTNLVVNDGGLDTPRGDLE